MRKKNLNFRSTKIMNFNEEKLQKTKLKAKHIPEISFIKNSKGNLPEN